jgi:hypothetical protein
MEKHRSDGLETEYLNRQVEAVVALSKSVTALAWRQTVISAFQIRYGFRRYARAMAACVTAPGGFIAATRWQA